ncbi:hypothetical protein [Natronoflexus pectinivorans]|uniref:TolB-like protein n=1 Tax=Natronoflexus pectinivorans TaxID=682526 RepID=A0A4R2G9J2_9BACT|nr:hypothetical protein [Natronoflexus pectinivorans]TCO04430.1 hypothetical protein EV194_11819 [Natronoflexus pectinivorans]
MKKIILSRNFQLLISSMLICFHMLSYVACKSEIGNCSKPEYLDKQAGLTQVDSIVCVANENSVFTTLFPISHKNNNISFFDFSTYKILKFKENRESNIFQIKHVLDVKNDFQMHPGFLPRLFGVINTKSNKYVLLSEPYSILTDKNLNFNEKIVSNVNTNKQLFHRIGNITHVFNDTISNNIYFPVSPDLPENHIDFYNIGRILKVNLETNTSTLLQLGLPDDYKPNTKYGLFSIPLLVVLNDNLYYIFPGSNYLYQYNLRTNNLHCILIRPKYAKIGTKEIGNDPNDIFFSLFECDIFYRMIVVNDKILLLYWKGKRQESAKPRATFKDLNCFMILYCPKKNEVLFDSYLDVKGVNKNPVYVKNDILYFQKLDELNMNEIKTTFLRYRISIED